MNDSDRIAELERELDKLRSADLAAPWKNRIAELEAEVARLEARYNADTDMIQQLREELDGASLHPETGVSVVDDVRDLKAEVADLKSSVVLNYNNIKELRAENLRLSEQVKAEVDAAVRAERERCYQIALGPLGPAAVAQAIRLSKLESEK
jgi:chromosome segregation ATPase